MGKRKTTLGQVTPALNKFNNKILLQNKTLVARSDFLVGTNVDLAHI